MLERADAGVGQILQTLAKLGSRAEHARHFHQRQRRRVALAQRAAVRIGKAHCGRAASACRRSSGGRGGCPPGRSATQAGIFMDLTRRFSPRPARRCRPRRGSKASICCQSSTAGRPSSARCSGARRHQKAVRRGDWKLLANGYAAFLFNLRATRRAQRPGAGPYRSHPIAAAAHRVVGSRRRRRAQDARRFLIHLRSV